MPLDATRSIRTLREGPEILERFIGGVAMARASWRVLRADRELLVFPAVSFLVTALISICFLVPFWASGMLTDLESGQIDIAMVLVGFLYYLTLYSVVIFCNVAVVAGALIRLQGGDPTISDGFHAAFERLPAIIGYAAIAATVGMVLRSVAERTGPIGRLVLGGLGVAWSLATFLVAPVLVVEGVGPLRAIVRSSTLLRTTWGEQIGGNVGIGLVFGPPEYRGGGRGSCRVRPRHRPQQLCRGGRSRAGAGRGRRVAAREHDAPGDPDRERLPLRGDR